MLATRATIDLFGGLPGVSVQVRGYDWRLIECNEAFANELGVTPTHLLGTHLKDVMPASAAEERIAFLRPVCEGGGPMRYVSMWRGRRCVSMVYALDAQSVGAEGLMGVIQPTLSGGADLPICKHPVLGRGLETLSRAELGVVYLFAKCLTVEQIARRLHRSTHTVQQHFKLVRRKTGMRRQAELMAHLTRAGIAGFTDAQWREMTGAHV